MGAVGRTVDDVALFAAAMTGDRSLMALELPDGAKPRIAMCKTHEWPYADADSHAAMQHAATTLAQAGMALPELTLPDLFGQLLQAQIEIMGFDLARSLAWERLTHPEKLSASLSGVLRNGLNLPLSQHRANLQLARSARAMVSAGFGEFDFILAPSTTGEAPPTLEQTGNPVFGRVWTLLGLPCVHLPFFTGRTGMPVGLQVIGRFGHDRGVLQAAKWLMQQLKPS